MAAYQGGWEDAEHGNNMVRNSTTGQMVDKYHSAFTSAQGPGLPQGPQAPGGVQPIGVGGQPAPQTAQQAITSAAPVGGQTQPGAPTTVAGSFQQALVNRLAGPRMTAASPEVQPAIQANQLSEQRGFDRNRAMLAERNAAQGFSGSGGNESMIRGLAQDRAGRESTFAGNAVMDANKMKESQITSLLGLTGGMLGNIDNQQLQRYGMDLDAQLRREGVGASTGLGRDDLALREKLGMGNLNLGLAGLLQGGQQFGQSLASNNAQFSAGLNQQALLQMLGGL
jgi:hypothetical protein